ncbi:hypothetical protein HGO34_02105 [Agrobacterium vitis]|uniref:hypothetical protein n=1 Tax=Rhizobium/Agrobacterium group TaxID=227290 RepID=UPI001F246C54|nr:MULTISPECIES: hypothetical protein [Rhizobium/Agrobacterium group]MCF1501704.1 hypothetical protein [Allorhizobium sp. Av2]MCM2438510.1 hypothetical protein [Agrobacterium vitis]MCM2473154.1 hypothetical protein [Rhizobium sp. CG5]
MSGSFDFSLDEDWSTNIGRLKAHLETIDAECAKILFDNLAILETGDNNARRDFNQKVLEALEAAAQAEIASQGGE